MEKGVIYYMEKITGINNTTTNGVVLIDVDEISEVNEKFSTYVFESDNLDMEFINKLYYILFTDNVEFQYKKINNKLIKNYNIINKENIIFKHFASIDYLRFRKKYSLEKEVTLITICSYLQLHGITDQIEIVNTLVDYLLK